MSGADSLATPPTTPTVPKTPTTAAFEALALTPASNRTEICKAYHRMSIATHPDKTGSAATAPDFRRIQQAYEVLIRKLEEEEKDLNVKLKIVIEQLNEEAIERKARLLEDHVVFAAFWAYCYFIPSAMVGMAMAYLLASHVSASLPGLVGEIVFRSAIAGACLFFVGQAFGHRLIRLIAASHA